MASTLDSFTAQIQHVATQPNNARLAAYDSLISDLLQQPSSKLSRNELLEITSAYLRHAVFSEQNSTGGGLVIGRQALNALEHHAGRIAEEYELQQRDKDRMQDVEDETMPPIADRDTRRQMLENALGQLQPRVLSFEEQASSLRMQLASLLEAEEDWKEAAQVLLAIPLDSGHRNVSDHFKLSIYVRIARLLLEGDDPVAADVYLKRASMIIHNVPGSLPSHYQQQQQQQEQQASGSSTKAAEGNVANNAAASGSGSASASSSGSKHKLEDPKVLGLQYRLCQARVYDSQRRFAEAAIRYHELSYVAEIDEDDRAMMLSAAVTASILSPAGPQRARTLATLMRDERTPSLPQYTILSKVFLDRVIRPDEIASFEKLLSPHQIAKLAPSSGPTPATSSTTSTARDASVRHAPSTVLDRAMIEHNVLSASRLYDNITLAGLGALVDLSPEGAEDIARKMIMQGRLKGWIDQVGNSAKAGARGGGVLFFVDQDRRGEGETTAGGLEATKGGADGSSGDGGSGAGGAGGEGGAGGAGGAADVDTKWTRRWDQQIAQVTGALEDVCQRINKVAGSTAAVA